jgi:hypothetical protein
MQIPWDRSKSIDVMISFENDLRIFPNMCKRRMLSPDRMNNAASSANANSPNAAKEIAESKSNRRGCFDCATLVV